MIEDLKPYPQYKDVGLNWLPSAPAHWDIQRIKTVLQEVDRRSTAGLEPLLSLRMHAGLVDHHASGGKRIPPTALIGYKRVLPGEIVMNRMRASLGLFAVATSDGLVSPDYAVFRQVGQLNGDYAIHLFRTPAMAAVFRIESTGLGTGESGFLRLYSDQFGRLAIPIPPPIEQAAIVRFLDWANGRVERAIRAKRKVIALLNEQKQEIIQRAVTRGVDPFVPIKPSGISWLGGVPAHWEVTALRRYWRVTDCKHLTVPFADGGIPLASVVEVQQFSLDLSRCKHTKPEWYRLLIDGDRKPRRGDLIYCRNASVGACALVEIDIDFAMGQDVCLIRSSSQNQRFLNYLLHSPFMKHQLDLLLVGSTFKRINVRDIKALTVTVPPRQEQDAVCEFLDASMVAYDTAITSLEREIQTLREYRTRLVADVVAGKLDVRDTAAHLPEEAQPEGIDDNADTSEEPEITDEEATS